MSGIRGSWSSSLLVLIAVGALGCGDDAPTIGPEPATPAPVASPSVPAPSASPPSAPVPPEDELPVEPATRELSVLSYVPGEALVEVEVDTITLGDDDARVTAPTFALRDEAARDALARAIAAELTPSPDATDVIDTRCSAELATERLVSMTCYSVGSGGRTGFDHSAFELAYLVEGATVRRVRVHEAIAPGEPLAVIAERACRARAAEEGDPDGRACGDEWGIAVTFGARGLVVHAYLGGEDLVTEIPYDAPELRDRLLADGPLGALWPAAQRRTVSISSDVLFAAHPWAQWTFGPTRSLELAALAALAVERDHYTPASVAAVEGGFRSVIRLDVASQAAFAEAQARARSFAGEPITRLSNDVPALSVSWMTTTQELALRSGPGTSSAMLRNLPLGTGVLGIAGAIDGRSSESGARGTWMRVVVAEGISGWVAGRYLRSGICLLPNLSPSLWPEAARGSMGSTLFGEAWGHHFAVIDGAARSWVLDAPTCSFEGARVIEIEGRIDTLRWLPVGRTGGHLLLAISLPVAPDAPGFDGTMRWSLVAPGATTAGWSTTGRGHWSVPENERADFGTAVRDGRTTWDLEVAAPGDEARRVRWDGSAFVEPGP